MGMVHVLLEMTRYVTGGDWFLCCSKSERDKHAGESAIHAIQQLSSDAVLISVEARAICEAERSWKIYWATIDTTICFLARSTGFGY